MSQFVLPIKSKILHVQQLVAYLCKFKGKSVLNIAYLKFFFFNLWACLQFNLPTLAVQRLETVPGKQGSLVREKCKRVFSKNYDFDKLRNISKILQGDNSVAVEMEPSALLCFKFAPITSVNVKRSFSQMKNVLPDRRLTITPEKPKKTIRLSCVITVNKTS